MISKLQDVAKAEVNAVTSYLLAVLYVVMQGVGLVLMCKRGVKLFSGICIVIRQEETTVWPRLNVMIALLHYRSGALTRFPPKLW